MQHGYHTIEIRDNVFIVSLIGSFDEYDIQGYIDDIRSFVSSMEGKPAYQIVNDYELVGITPEGYQQLEANNQWLLNHNLLAKAIVSDKPVQQNLDFRWTPSLQKLNTRYFTDMQEAEQWIDEVKKQV